MINDYWEELLNEFIDTYIFQRRNLAALDHRRFEIRLQR